VRRLSAREAGFTLLEVMVALSILGISLGALLSVQTSSIGKAARSRDLTLATLLSRSKLIDIEQRLFHEGFTAGTEQTDGNFSEEGYADFFWKARLGEVRLDMSHLLDVCQGLSGDAAGGSGKKPSGGSVGGVLGGLMGGGPTPGGTAGTSGGDGDEAFSCESILGAISASMGGFMEQVSGSLRTLDLSVCWGGQNPQRMRIKTLLSRDDFALEQQKDAQRGANALGGVPGALPGMLPPGMGR
jgi:general secretion pathway protein I